MTSTYINRQRVGLSLQQPVDYWVNGFEWDLAGRLSSVASRAGTFTYHYTALNPSFSGRLVWEWDLPNGAYITNSYDSVARELRTLLKDSGSSTLDAALYGYNEGSQRAAYTNAAGAYVQYGYDPIGQLTVANSSEPLATYEPLTYRRLQRTPRLRWSCVPALSGAARHQHNKLALE